METESQILSGSTEFASSFVCLLPGSDPPAWLLTATNSCRRPGSPRGEKKTASTRYPPQVTASFP